MFAYFVSVAPRASIALGSQGRPVQSQSTECEGVPYSRGGGMIRVGHRLADGGVRLEDRQRHLA